MYDYEDNEDTHHINTESRAFIAYDRTRTEYYTSRIGLKETERGHMYLDASFTVGGYGDRAFELSDYFGAEAADPDEVGRMEENVNRHLRDLETLSDALVEHIRGVKEAISLANTVHLEARERKIRAIEEMTAKQPEG